MKTEFKIAIQKLDKIAEKIYYNDKKADEQELKMDIINLIASLILETGAEFGLNYFSYSSISDYIVFDNILDFATKFYSENKDKYEHYKQEYISIRKKNEKYVKLFNKITDQLEFLYEKQK